MAEPLPRSVKNHFAAISILIIFCLSVVGVDSISSILLWILAGNLSYLKNNVVDFVFEDSTFDLACISVGRALILAFSLLYLEQWVLRKLPTIIEDSHGSKPKLITLVLVLIVGIGFVCFSYGVVKIALIIKYWKETRVQLHVAYKILVVTSILFPLVEFVVGAVNRVVRWMNSPALDYVMGTAHCATPHPSVPTVNVISCEQGEDYCATAHRPHVPGCGVQVQHTTDALSIESRAQ